MNMDTTGEQVVVIVGAGLAGGNAAVTLREEGWRGRIVLLGAEPGIPFGRPPLSKTYLRSEEDLSAWYVKPADWYGDHDIELRTGSIVRRVDTALKQLRLASGETVDYDKLVLCTGGRNRNFAAPGASLPGVYQLRTVAECDAIRQVAQPGARAVVVGMGFIGSEVAASLRQIGLEVSAAMRTGSSRAASGTICRKNRLWPLPKLSSMLTVDFSSASCRLTDQFERSGASPSHDTSVIHPNKENCYGIPHPRNHINQ
jgi:NADH dehydrogenase FAD-containing subunit